MKIRYQTDGPLRAERLHVMRYRRFAATILVIGGVAWTSRAGATFNTIDVPGAANGTSAAGINARGQIVGSYADAAGHNLAFLLDHGTFTTIDFPGAACTQAIGINARGQIVGGYAEKSCNPFAGMVPHGFFLDDGNFTTIDVTRARGINNRGQIVGEAGANCFLLDGGTFTTIKVPFAGVRITFCSGINDRGQIVGGYFDTTSHGFLLDDGAFTTIDVPGATSTTPNGINDRGQIVGVYYDSAGNHGHGFLLDDGTLTTIDVPGAPYTNAQGINNRGEIVGFYSYPTTGSLGFLLDFDRRLVACPSVPESVTELPPCLICPSGCSLRPALGQFQPECRAATLTSTPSIVSGMTTWTFGSCRSSSARLD